MRAEAWAGDLGRGEGGKPDTQEATLWGSRQLCEGVGEFALQATSNAASALGLPAGTCLGKAKEEMNQAAGQGCWPQDCPTLSAGVWTLPTPPACLLGASLPQGQRINKLLLVRPQALRRSSLRELGWSHHLGYKRKEEGATTEVRCETQGAFWSLPT